MNLDVLLWVVRAVIIAIGITVGTMMWKGKKEGRHQKYSFRFFALGIPILIIGIILQIVSLLTDLSSFYGIYLTAIGAIASIIGLVIRNIWEKNH